MPDQGQIAQFGLFTEGFLQIVFAEVVQSGGMGLAQIARRFGLAHGQQADGRRVALCGLCCVVNSLSER